MSINNPRTQETVFIAEYLQRLLGRLDSDGYQGLGKDQKPLSVLLGVA